MNIAIIGTRGIPNYYGGFEQFAQYLSRGLVKQGHQVTVYNSHKHPYQESVWKDIKIIHKYDPEDKLGTAGQFIYDLNCILDVRKRNFDIILQLGYTSSSIWGRLLPRKNSIVTTNMDGLEWKRSKYPKPVQKFLLYAEKLGVKHSDYLISDSIGIKDYLKEKYGKESVYIPYGSNLFTSPNEGLIKDYKVVKYKFNMLIARLEPENSIEIILDGVSKCTKKDPFLVIGNHETEYGDYLKGKFKDHPHIRFVGGIYDIEVLNNLRHYSNIYFHGHTVGGTNPSLLEAMGSQALICAHDNVFNKAILNEDAFYFKTSNDLVQHLMMLNKEEQQDKIENNNKKIVDRYSWDTINEQYLMHFQDIIKSKKK